MSNVTLNLKPIEQTFLMVNLLIHDFLHDFDLKNTGNVSRLKRSQKLFNNIISALPTEGGGMKGGSIDLFLRWVSGEAVPGSIEYYDEGMVRDARNTLETLAIFQHLGADVIGAAIDITGDELNTYIESLLRDYPLRSQGDIIKKIKLVFNLVNDIILYTVGFLNTPYLLGYPGTQSLYQQELFDVDGNPLLRGGISPIIYKTSRGSPGSPSKSLLGSPGSPFESPFVSPLKSPPSPMESKTKKLTQQQKYNNYVSSFISAIDIFKFKASKEIEDEDNKKAYEIFLTNFSDVFKLVTQKYNTVDPFKILNSLYFKKILVVFLMVGENTDKSEILKGFLNNSLYSEKEKKINVGELIEKYKLNIKEPKPEEPKPKDSKVSKLIEFFEKKNIQKGGTREQDLEDQNELNWSMFFEINMKMDNLINDLSSTIQDSIQTLEGVREQDGDIDVFVTSTVDTIRDTFVNINQVIESFIQEITGWSGEWQRELAHAEAEAGAEAEAAAANKQIINLEKTLIILQKMNQVLTTEYTHLETLLAEPMEIFRSIRQQVRAAVERNKQFQGSFDNLIDILNSFVTQNIEQLIQIKDTYLTQIETNTNQNNKELQKIRSADLSPEEILLGNKINRCYTVGMFKFLNLLDINYDTGGSLVFTERMEDIIDYMKERPHDIYCKLLSLEFFILFRNNYTSGKLWNDFNNMTYKRFDWSTEGLGSGLDTQLINGVQNILHKVGINYELPEVNTRHVARNIINNSYIGLRELGVDQDNNVLCPYASIVDAMPVCSYTSALARPGAFVEKNMNFRITDGDSEYMGKINASGKYVDYTMEVVSPIGRIDVTLNNISLENGTILQANSVYAALLQDIFVNMHTYFDVNPIPNEKYIKMFWYRLTDLDMFVRLPQIGMRKGAGDFFQEVFATFQNNGGPAPNVVPDGPIYGLMGDRPSGVRCIFFNLLGRDENPTINPNNISGYGTKEYNVIISAAPPPMQGGFKKTRRNKRKMNKKTRRNKRKSN